MEIKRAEHYIEINGVDNNGDFKIYLLKDCSQLQIETTDSSVCIDVDFKELKIIRDCINEVLKY